MAIKTLNLDAEWDFVSKHDDAEKDSGEQTVFTLGTLSNRLLSYLSDKATTFKGTSESDVEASIMNASLAIEIVKYGVRDIRNLPDKDGNTIPFETQKACIHGMDVRAIKPHILDVLPKAIVMEVADELQKRNDLSEDEAKN